MLDCRSCTWCAFHLLIYSQREEVRVKMELQIKVKHGHGNVSVSKTDSSVFAGHEAGLW